MKQLISGNYEFLVVSTSHFNAYILRIVIACTAIIDALEYVDFEA